MNAQYIPNSLVSFGALRKTVQECETNILLALNTLCTQLPQYQYTNIESMQTEDSNEQATTMIMLELQHCTLLQGQLCKMIFTAVC